jgi:hypothetical protein
MCKKMMVGLAVITGLLMLNANWLSAADDKEVLGVTFPGEIIVAGKTLHLNGVAYRKALGFIKVNAVGLYLERTTKDADEVIESEQVKHMVTHFLTDKATAKKIRKGFLDLIQKCNPEKMVITHKEEIETYAGWLDKDMKPGQTSISTYVPGKGLTLVYQGEEKGTIVGKEFAQMYYRYNVGEKASKKLREGLLGK